MEAALAGPLVGKGYLVADLERFLAATGERVDELQRLIDETRTRLDREGEEGAEVAARRRIATAWMAAQQEADAIRAAAEMEAESIIHDAEEVVAGRRAVSDLVDASSRTTREADAAHLQRISTILGEIRAVDEGQDPSTAGWVSVE